MKILSIFGRPTAGRFASTCSLFLVPVFAVELSAIPPACSSDTGSESVDKRDCCSSLYLTADGKLDDSKYGDDATADPRRVESAKRIIAGLREFMRLADAQHKRIQQDLLLAQALKGETGSTMLNGSASTSSLQGSATKSVRPGMAPSSIVPRPLTGSALANGRKQYVLDVKQFADHAQTYQALMAKFQKEVGECKASEALYQAQVNDFTIHSSEFHHDMHILSVQDRMAHVIIIPDGVKPPHICGVLQLTKAEADQYYQRILKDQGEATVALGPEAADYLKADNELGRAEAGSDYLSKKAVKEAEREQREQELAAAFARLRQEQAQLKYERQFLSLDGSKSSVHSIARGSKPLSKASSSVRGAIRQGAH